jgi:two-component sensor histidine kinase
LFLSTKSRFGDHSLPTNSMGMIRLQNTMSAKATDAIADFLHWVWPVGASLIVCGFLAAPVSGHSAQAPPPSPTPETYQTAASILALSHEQLNRHHPAHLRGQVIRSTEWGVTLLDRTAGIWVYFDHPFRDLTAGDELDVIGTTSTGLYSPVVDATSVRKVGHAPLSKPVSVDFKQLSTGNFDAQYVTITGVVRSVGIRPDALPSQNVWMKVEMADGTIDVAFPVDCEKPAGQLIDALVRFKGAGSSAKNQNMQLTAPTLMMSSMAGVTVLRPPPRNQFALPITPIGNLMQYRSGTDFYHRVRVAGIVTYYKPGESIILEDQGQALYVEMMQTDSIRLGDRVEAFGFPAPSDTGPILRDAIIHDIGSGQQLLPAAVTPADLSTGKFSYNFISTEGRLLRKVREPSREVLLLQVQSSLLLAELAEAEKPNVFERLQEGSTIRISGISILDITGTWNTGGPGASSIHYRVLLRSPDDVLVLQPPSWWTRTRVIYIAGVLAILALIFLAMVVYGRMEGWRLQAVIGERERLANEVHDTLAQSFAGIGFQLQAIRKAIPDEQEELREQIDLARALVRHSHKEARRSIEPMSSETPEEIDILSALEGSARTMVNGGAVQVNAEMIGTPRSIPPKIAASLLRIGQEAIANAVRHADPSHLQIAVAHENNFVRVRVEDDGCGFVKSGGLLGFGLRGMRKRAAALSAKLEITSNLGQGTCVEVTAPVPPSVTLPALVHQMWQHFSESVLHVQAKAE